MTDPHLTPTQEEDREFRKTATIRARQWWKDGDHPAVTRKTAPNRHADEGIPWIETLEGGHVVSVGDWIATGVQGEHWPIKPDVFAATYAPVESHREQSTASLRAERDEALTWAREQHAAADRYAARLSAAEAEAAALRAQVERLERELASRPQWAGGQSPITTGSGCAALQPAAQGETP